MSAAAAVALPQGAVVLLGGSLTDAVDLASPWSRTHTVAGAPLRGPFAGERLVVQWGGDRAGIGRRIRLGQALRAAAPDLRIPEVLGGSMVAPVPWVASRCVAGTSGRAMLEVGGDAEVALVGAVAGAVAVGLREVPAASLRLSRTWADATSLAAAARRWRNLAAPALEGGSVRALDAELALIGHRLGGVAPVVAHGDLAPVNLLLAGGRLVGLLDLERVRLAHPLFDAAWWCWILAVHHLALAPAVNLAFLAAADIPRDAATVRQLHLLAVLQCLELAASPRLPAGGRSAWADRVIRLLAMPAAQLAGG